MSIIKISHRATVTALMSMIFIVGNVPEYRAEGVVSEDTIQRFIETGDYDIDALPCFLLIGIFDGELDPNVYINVSVVINTMIRLHTRNIHHFSDDYDYDTIFDNVYESCFRLGVELPILDVLDSIY